jgi:hypothetical protein
MRQAYQLVGTPLQHFSNSALQHFRLAVRVVTELRRPTFANNVQAEVLTAEMLTAEMLIC